MDDVVQAAGHNCLVPLVEDEDFSAPFRKSAERVSGRVGMVANNVRAMANSPELGATMRQFLDDVWDQGELPKPLKALIRHKVSNINACLYCSAHQVRVMESQGVAREKIDNMHDFRSHPEFSDKERAILAYCEALALDAGTIPEDVVATFVDQTTAQERTEVTIVAATMGLLNQLNDGLRVPLEEPMLEIASGISFEPR
ncbi:MAG: carboxymuconolactone decarboxylase family protein [Rhodospirillaceae bacterium]|jgi:alkylhydroperoxidase family enzyme|nr:carboxymuconolactone decarboxylase family protein [Rhodospirillaceae bacterium]MBT3810851.1 carboxymuconolactone decarboxylase family protein [Rhodospirillaceae bacterium]MBT3932114.1 carboxymuconolactone decarboxylase family protein [Rhodospirillaceae bacterium]MBT4773021.1 carboxymuconolactone decarboxylase family protein [Rhodospirillaceae bacterium]MBT5359051.1 carboxymuconolactone decarboxylase family protein [Rhodospirillaceae bacterium]